MNPAFCSNCGAKLTGNSRFCPECGARLADVSLPSEPAPEPEAQPTPEQPAPEPTMALPVAQPAPVVPPTVPLSPAAADVPPAQPVERRSNARLIIGALIALGALLFGACIGLVLVTLNFSDSQRGSLPEAPLAETAVVPLSTPVAAPPLDAGEVLFSDTFDDPAASVFGTEESDVSRFAFEAGGYLIEAREPEYIVWWSVDEVYRDVVISTDTVFPPESLEAAAALIFHYQDPDNFYLFSVSNDGFYALELKLDGEWTYLIDWTESPEIDAVRNALRVETVDEQIALYVNNVLLEETIDETYVSGDVGLAVVSFGEAPAITRFDNLVIARSR